METTTRRELDLEHLTLEAGAHSPDGVMCVMEAVAFVAGEYWTDSPQCASPAIAAFCRAWNDISEPYGSAIRGRLKHYIPRLVRSRGTDEQEGHRSLMALDWLIRTHLRTWLRQVPALAAHAEELAALSDLTRPGTDYRAVGLKVRAAWDAAGAAARAAAWDAARAAARAALKPTVDELQASAWELLDRMLAVTEQAA